MSFINYGAILKLSNIGSLNLSFSYKKEGLWFEELIIRRNEDKDS